MYERHDTFLSSLLNIWKKKLPPWKSREWTQMNLTNDVSIMALATLWRGEIRVARVQKCVCVIQFCTNFAHPCRIS